MNGIKVVLIGIAFGIGAGATAKAWGLGAYNKCYTTGAEMRCISPTCIVFGSPCVQYLDIMPPEWVHTCSEWGISCFGSPATCSCSVGGGTGQCPTSVAGTCP